MTQLQVARLTNLARKLFVLRGSPPATELLDEVTPVVVLEGERAEHRLLAGERLGFGGGNQGAAVGLLSMIQLFNPVDSGVIATIEMMEGIAALGTTVRFVLNDAALAALNNRQGSRDTRNHPTAGFNLGTTLVIRTQQLAAIPGNSNTVWEVAQNTARTDPVVRYEQPGLVLAQGHGLIITALANQAIDANFSWRERELEVGE